MYRYDIINRFIDQRFSPDCDYLEIGVYDPSYCFNLINSNRKISVDPGQELHINEASFKMTSDEFFDSLQRDKLEIPKDFKWDIIFIDGLHIAEQNFKDIINALRHTKEDSVIVLHDCNPPTWKHAHSDTNYFYENLNVRDPWNGTVWKSFYFARTLLDYATYTIDTDWGVGIIDKKHDSIPIKHENIFFDYGRMMKNRVHDLALITVEEFLQKDLS